MDNTDLESVFKKASALANGNAQALTEFVTFLLYTALNTLPQDYNQELKKLVVEKDYMKLIDLLLQYDPKNLDLIVEYFQHGN
jgi:hypothetical protein